MSLPTPAPIMTYESLYHQEVATNHTLRTELLQSNTKYDVEHGKRIAIQNDLLVAEAKHTTTKADLQVQKGKLRESEKRVSDLESLEQSLQSQVARLEQDLATAKEVADVRMAELEDATTSRRAHDDEMQKMKDMYEERGREMQKQATKLEMLRKATGARAFRLFGRTRRLEEVNKLNISLKEDLNNATKSITKARSLLISAVHSSKAFKLLLCDTDWTLRIWVNAYYRLAQMGYNQLDDTGRKIFAQIYELLLRLRKVYALFRDTTLTEPKYDPHGSDADVTADQHSNYLLAFSSHGCKIKLQSEVDDQAEKVMETHTLRKAVEEASDATMQSWIDNGPGAGVTMLLSLPDGTPLCPGRVTRKNIAVGVEVRDGKLTFDLSKVVEPKLAA